MNEIENWIVSPYERNVAVYILNIENGKQVNTIVGFKFNDKFGFTEEELQKILEYYNLKEKSEDIKTWYNGYVFGGKVIYNPWSVSKNIEETKKIGNSIGNYFRFLFHR